LEPKSPIINSTIELADYSCQLKEFCISFGIEKQPLLTKEKTTIAGITAVVLWKPPSGCIPDVISSALRSGSGSSNFNNSLPSGSRPRIRCYSEVTSTPYSSHENLCGDTDMPDISLGPPQPCCLSPHHPHHPLSHPSQHCHQGSPTSAEAPELSHNGEIEVPIGVNLQRRNSAPEICEPTTFMDDGSMEL